MDEAIRAAMVQLQRDFALPRIVEDEWHERYGWLPNDEGDYELISETKTPGVQSLIDQHDNRYVWSQIDGSDCQLIVPGRRGNAIGYYLCERPWDESRLVAAVIDTD